MKKSTRIFITLLLSAFLSLIVFPVTVAFKFYFFLFPSLFMGFFLSFFVIIEYEFSRIHKGVLLILLGVFWGVAVPPIFQDHIPAHLMQNWEIFKNFVIFSCSGAGGSIIAAHVEQGYKKYESSLVAETVIDKTKQIETLISSVDGLKKSNRIIQLLCCSILLLCIIGIGLSFI